jgi:molecular chaperone GrpE (heat shock protein)
MVLPDAPRRPDTTDNILMLLNKLVKETQCKAELLKRMEQIYDEMAEIMCHNGLAPATVIGKLSDFVSEDEEDDEDLLVDNQ